MYVSVLYEDCDMYMGALCSAYQGQDPCVVHMDV